MKCRVSKPEVLACVLRWLLTGSLLLCTVTAAGQQDDVAKPSVSDDPAVPMFPHSQTARWWVSGQDNIVSQCHPSFDAKYSGANSFHAHGEHATSNIATLFTGFQLTSTTAFDAQHVNHPGYNRDRGPVVVPGLRVHLEF